MNSSSKGQFLFCRTGNVHLQQIEALLM
jgi:hypothetical protein